MTNKPYGIFYIGVTADLADARNPSFRWDDDMG